MKEWFYVKNDLKAREDIKDIYHASYLAALRPSETEGGN
jgi:hypothetical protein